MMGHGLRHRRIDGVEPGAFVKCRMAIPASTKVRLETLKSRHRLRNRDAVIGALIRKARTGFDVEDFSLPPEPKTDDAMIDIYPFIQIEHVAFLYRLQRRFHGAALGTTIEALIDTVGDIAPFPMQLPLLSSDMRK